MKYYGRASIRVACGACLMMICLSLPCLAGSRYPSQERVVLRIGLLMSQKPGPEERQFCNGARLAVSTHGNLQCQKLQTVLVLEKVRSPWSGGSTAVAQLVYDKRVHVLLVGPDRRLAHIAAMAVTRARGATLMMTISKDRSLTRSGVPWIFNLWLPTEKRPRGPRWLAFQERYYEAYGTQPDLAAAYAFDMIRLVQLSACQVGTEMKALRQALATVSYTGLTGPICFHDSGERSCPVAFE